MSRIASPQTTPEHPDHLLNCEEAIDQAYPAPRSSMAGIAEEAMEAGWDPDTVIMALAELLRAEPFTAEGKHHESD